MIKNESTPIILPTYIKTEQPPKQNDVLIHSASRSLQSQLAQGVEKKEAAERH